MTKNLENYVDRLTQLREQREALGWVADDDELLTDELHDLWDLLATDEQAQARELSWLAVPAEFAKRMGPSRLRERTDDAAGPNFGPPRYEAAL